MYILQTKSENSFQKQKKKLAKFCAVLLVISITFGCSAPEGYSNVIEVKNSPKQISEAKMVVEKYHDARLQNDTNTMFKLLFMKNISKENFISNKLRIDTILGSVSTIRFNKANSIIQTEGEKTIKYNTHLIYSSNFEKREVLEEFEVEKINDSLKITYYNLKINI